MHEDEPEEIKMSFFAFLYICVAILIIHLVTSQHGVRKSEYHGVFYTRFAYFPVKIEGEWIWFTKYYEMKIPLLYGGYGIKKITKMDYLYLKLQGKHQMSNYELWKDIIGPK